jgi:hypothetical protein
MKIEAIWLEEAQGLKLTHFQTDSSPVGNR